MDNNGKKSVIERFADFAHRNPGCFIVGTIVAGEVVNNAFKFILGLCGKKR
jgi:hypothetical protein